MNLLKDILLNLMVLTLLGACLPDPLEVEEVPSPEEQIVIGSQFIPNQFIVVSLTKNFTALEAGPDSELDSVLIDLLIPEIDMTITSNDVVYPMTEILRGIYAVGEIPQLSGSKYTLSFTNPINGLPTNAEAVALPLIEFTELTPELHYTTYADLLRVNFKIEDPPGDNWYMVNVQRTGVVTSLTERPFSKVYDQSDIDGNILEDEFTVFYREFTEQDTVLISTANISEGYYEFLKLRNNQQALLLDGLGEPVNYPTNVENGLGFFNVHIPDFKIFLLEDLE